jgi:hypothetical protein
MDLKTLIERMRREQQFLRVVNNPMAQFGPPERPLLGATILPERAVRQNEFTETAIRYRTQVANDGTRYSPVQKKRGILTGTMLVQMGHSDIGSEFTSSDYDAFLEVLSLANGQAGDAMTMEAMTRLLNWFDLTIRRPLDVRNEIQRWEAMVDASVVRRGDGGFRETVAFSNPSGHRFNASVVWSNNANDPMDDIHAAAKILEDKGYILGRIITSNNVVSKLRGNAKMKERVGKIVVAAGAAFGIPGRISKSDLGDIMTDEGLPVIEQYDEQYQTATGTGRYLKNDVVVMIAATGRDVTLQNPDGNPLVLQNTLGYQAIGRAAGQPSAGRAYSVEAYGNKPPRIESEGWQAAFPVILDPEGIVVIKSIT